MKWIHVESSNLDAVKYDHEMKILSVRFLNGGTYHFKEVPALFFFEILDSRSPGKYFAEFIKGKFDFVKEEPKEPK